MDSYPPSGIRQFLQIPLNTFTLILNWYRNKTKLKIEGITFFLYWQNEDVCKKISYPIHEGLTYDLFLCKSLVNYFEKLCHLEELELIKIRNNSQNALWEFLFETLIKALIKAWVEVLEAFTDVTKLGETFGLDESVLWHHEI